MNEPIQPVATSGAAGGSVSASSASLPGDSVAQPKPASPAVDRSPGRMRRAYRALGRNPNFAHPWEFLVLFPIGLFLLLYGLAPHVGGAKLGLVGADEPRYAQIAREMLQVHQATCAALHVSIYPHGLSAGALHREYECLMAGTVTPILNGNPWLEKPALYYWRAMGFFEEFGVSDWSARLPSESAAGFLILLIFLHMRRFRVGGHLEAALISVSCVAMLAFARGASTDMQLAAPFCIGMLGWYAWYETGKKFWLFDLYFFGAAATLAKGPVAPFLALAIIFCFVALRREWTLLRRTIWLPGIALYLLMVLPWYIAVQRRNPTFVREFFLQHNLERFATNRYQHHQPVYYYVVVLVLGLMPWTVLGLRALADAIGIAVAEWRVRRKRVFYMGNARAGDAFPEFLVLWALFPIVFFTLSTSKLPGYILPSIPPLTILTGDYLYRIRRDGLRKAMLVAHSVATGVLVFVLTLAPQHMHYETLVPSGTWLLGAGVAALATGCAVYLVVRRFGPRAVTYITLVPVVALLVFLLGFNGHELDLNYSARPLAQEIARHAPEDRSIALLNVKRDMDYGLTFYRNQPMLHYDDPREGVPAGEHVLVVRSSSIPELETFLAGRIYEPLFLYETQGLAVYRVLPAQGTGPAAVTPVPAATPAPAP